MSGLRCPHCNKEINLFKTGGGEKTAKELDVKFLGRMPIDPEIVRDSDEGKAFVLKHHDSETGRIFNGIVNKIEGFDG